MDQLRLFVERRPVRVLVLDDDVECRQVVAGRLERHHREYQVSSAAAADIAEVSTRLDEVDVVVIGVGSEPETLAPLRWLARNAGDTAVVALHHGNDLDEDFDLVVTGAQDFLPFAEASTARLDRVIRSALARKRAEMVALATAMADPVTGMASRAWMLQRLELAVAHAATCADGWQIAVLFCDLDRFKVINDTLGHSRGDVLLRLVAERLRSVVRAEDPVTRFGGDEFVILLEGHRIEGLAHRIGIRALNALASPFVIDGHSVSVHGSIGLALHRRGETASELLDHADLALYRAKRLGRNRLETFDEELREWAESQRDLSSMLCEDLRADRLELVREPLWDLKAGRRAGAVVTPSWAHTTSPHALVDLAVRHGLGPDLGRWMVRRAVTESARFDGDGQIVVDVPPGLVTQPSFVSWVEDELVRSAVDPSQLVLAISESELADTDLVRPVLDGLDRLGVSVGLSSFGSGAASLALFGSLLVDEVFLAPELVAGIAEDRPRRAVVESLIRIADAIGQRVIACGPDSILDATVLAELGCEAVVTHLDVSDVRTIPAIAVPDIADTEPLVLR